MLKDKPDAKARHTLKVQQRNVIFGMNTELQQMTAAVFHGVKEGLKVEEKAVPAFRNACVPHCIHA
jgi:hypothetical protein